MNKKYLMEGRKYEEQVVNYFEKLGWKAERKTVLDSEGEETSQTVFVNGNHLSHPDITIEKNKKGIFVKYFVEVKSEKKYRKRTTDINELNLGCDYFSIPCYQFIQYGELSDRLDVPVYVIFIDKLSDNNWYWESWWNLNLKKIYVSDGYKDGRSHFFWDIEDLTLLER